VAVTTVEIGPLFTESARVGGVTEYAANPKTLVALNGRMSTK
jgi:hypothetical protein